MRPVWDVDLPAIEQALRELKDRSPAAQMRIASVHAALFGIRMKMRENKAFMHGGFLILVDVGKPWYSPYDVLIEELVLRVYPAGTARAEDIPRVLESIAKDRGLQYIVSGDTQVGLMGKRYEAAGFELIGQQYFKEITP